MSKFLTTLAHFKWGKVSKQFSISKRHLTYAGPGPSLSQSEIEREALEFNEEMSTIFGGEVNRNGSGPSDAIKDTYRISGGSVGMMDVQTSEVNSASLGITSLQPHVHISLAGLSDESVKALLASPKGLPIQLHLVVQVVDKRAG